MTDKPLAFLDFETSPIDPLTQTVERVLGYCVVFDDETHICVPFVDHKTFKEGLRELADNYSLVFHNAAFELYIFEHFFGVAVPSFDDTLLMSYLTFPDRPPVKYTYLKNGKKKTKVSQHSLGSWGVRLGDYKLDAPEFTEWTEEMATYCLQDARLTKRLFYHLAPQLGSDDSLLECYQKIDLPFTRCIIEMQLNGLGFDIDALDQFIQKRQVRCEELISEMRKIVHVVPSTKRTYLKEQPCTDQPEIGKLKFEGIEPIPDTRKGKPADATRSQYIYRVWEEFSPSKAANVAYALIELYGWEPKEFSLDGTPSVGKEIIAQLDYPLCELLKEYSKQSKALTTYGESIKERLVNGRLHCSYNATGTITGRLSSNAQQFPAKGDLGKEYRSCIVPREGYKMVVADKSQFQLRITAYLLYKVLGLSHMMELLNSGDDAHTATAKLAGIERSIAKNVNFAILFRASVQRLAKMVGCDEETAQGYWDVVSDKLRIEELIEAIIDNCKNNYGQVYTIYGRRLIYPDVLSQNFKLRKRAERQLFNAVVQGSEADIMKMITMMSVAACRKYDALIVAQVHDEVVYEVPEKNSVPFAKAISYIFSFEGFLPGMKRMDETANIGNNWAEAK